MKVLFVASFSPIVRDGAAAQAFYRDALGRSFEKADGDYGFTEKLGGVKHFGLWPLAEAAKACFGTREWPPHLPIPQATSPEGLLVAVCYTPWLHESGQR